VSTRWRALAELAVWALYAALFLWLYPERGSRVAAIAVVPVAFSALLHGVRAGLLLGVASVPINVGLAAWLEPAGAGSYLGDSSGLGTFGLIAVGGLVGWMRNVNGEQRRELTRRSATLRFARRAAAETHPNRVLAALLEEACSLVGAEGGAVRRWDDLRRRLVPVEATAPFGDGPSPSFDDELADRAAAERRPVIVGDATSDVAANRRVGEGGVRSGVALPVLHDGHLLGVLSVLNTRRRATLPRGDIEALEILAGIAAASLAGLQRSRLAGVLLAARTAQHEIRNALTAALACAELMAEDPSLPDDLRLLADEALRGTTRARNGLERLGRLTRIQELDWGPGAEPTIDLEHSAA
jgi:GAF domain-containing protein